MMDKKPLLHLSISESRMNRLALVVCGGVFLYHFAVVWRYAVNVPFFDEWAVFNPYALPAGFSLRWLFAQHNEHRLVTTKLLVWAQFLLNGWDTALHQAVNFVVFGLLLAWLHWFARRFAGAWNSWREFDDYRRHALSEILIRQRRRGALPAALPRRPRREAGGGQAARRVFLPRADDGRLGRVHRAVNR